MSTFVTRTISGIILVLIAILALVKGGFILLTITAAVSLIGTYELLRAIKLDKAHIGIVAYISVIAYNILLYMQKTDFFLCLFVCMLLLLLALYVFTYPKYTTEQIAMTFFIFLYAGVLLSFIYQVRCMENGYILVWLIVVGAWGSDTFAYLTGMLLGKHKLPSELSPKKTIEGCIGGVIGAALIGFVFSFFYPDGVLFYLSPQIVFPIIGAFGSVFSQTGDLAASAIKRNHGVKDYGDLIPGHGGIMDRFDSMLFVAPIVYYLLTLLSELR